MSLQFEEGTQRVLDLCRCYSGHLVVLPVLVGGGASEAVGPCLGH